MKVLQVCAYAAQYGGNFIASLKALEKQLSENNVVTEYLFPVTAKEFAWCKELQKTARVYFAGANRFSLNTYREVHNAMQEADIVHSHFELYDCITALAAKKGQKLVWHLHDSFDERIDLAHRILNRFQYGFLGKKAWLISPSQYYANYAMKLGFPVNRISVVPNGIDFQRLGHQNAGNKKYDFLVFGGFFKIKGLDILLDACRLLIYEGFEFKIGVVGYEETWKYLNSNYADLENYVIKISPCEDVCSIYEGTKVFLSTSRRECFSYALLEALHMGIPTIASDIPGNSWVSKYKSVVQFELENAKELARIMKQYLNDDVWFSEEDLKATSKDVAKTYNLGKWVRTLREVYFDARE